LSISLEKRIAILTAVLDLLKDKKIIPQVAHIYTLDEISRAVKHSLESNRKVKVLLK